MSLMELGALGEFVSAIVVIATLAYLGIQIRQSNTIARSQARQTLIDTWSAADWEVSQDPRSLKILGEGLNNWPDLPDEDKFAFDMMMGRYLANLQNGVLLKESGILDQQTLETTSNYMLMCILTPGGRNWWKDTTRPWPEVKAYLDARLADSSNLPISIDEAMPFAVSHAQR